MKRLMALLLVIAALVPAVSAQRRISPVQTQATRTQSVNETATDTARINERRRAQSISYIDDRGLTIYVDTITNTEWTDSTLIGRVPKMQYPLLHSLSVGVNIWDPVMRLFGQHHGLTDAWVELDMHNRYKIVAGAGLGMARHRASDNSYLYRSPLSVFFRLGADYNFLFNSNPAYQFMAGVRYGFSPFSYSVDDVHLNDSYWGESSVFNIPSQHATAGWFELCLGLRVKLWGPISAGWTFKYHTIVHESKAKYGKPWYIPGYGSRNGSVTGAFSIVYTIPLSHMNKKAPEGVITEEENALQTPAEAGNTGTDATGETASPSTEQQ